MTDSLFRIFTRSAEETRKFGQMVGRLLDRPLVMGLEGDLGAGKTVFVQGLATGLDVPESVYVTSPTYTLINEYPGRLVVFHADLYRLDSVDPCELGLLECEQNGVLVIEWVERLDIEELSPDIFIRFKIFAESDEKREIRMISGSRAGLAFLEKILRLS